MKRLNLFLLGLAAIGMVFTSCADDETVNEPPMLQVIDSEGFVVDGAEVVTSQTFKVKLNGTANATSGAELISLEVLAVFNNTTVVDTIIDIDKQPSFVADLSFDAPSTVGTGKITFTLTDRKNQYVEETINVTFIDAPSTLKSFSAILVGGNSHATLGSALDADLGVVYLKADAKVSQELIDLVYYYGTANNATFAAPNDVTLNGGSGNLDYCTDWTIKNATTFNTNPGITAAEFDALTTGADLAAISTSDSKVSNMSNGDVLVFTTADNKKGAIKVVAITGQASGTIEIDVKIEE